MAKKNAAGETVTQLNERARQFRQAAEMTRAWSDALKPVIDIQVASVIGQIVNGLIHDSERWQKAADELRDSK